MPGKPESVTAKEITPLEMPVPDAPPPGDAMVVPGDAPAAAAAAPAAAPAATGEIDSGGVVFDPLRHTHARHPHTGCWMPRGGRKPKPKPNAPAGPPAASYIPPGEPAPAPAPPAEPTPPAGPDHSDAAAECVARSAQFVAGLAFDAPDDCTPPAAEHDSMVRASAAYIRAKGWNFTAGAAVFVVFLAWLLRLAQKPRPRAKLREWLNGDASGRARDVTPEKDRPAKGSPSGQGAVIDLPPNIPPLARP